MYQLPTWQVSSKKRGGMLQPALRRVMFCLLLGVFTGVLSFLQLFFSAICLQ